MLVVLSVLAKQLVYTKRAATFNYWMHMKHKPKLGQNFLVDDAARHAIVDALGDVSQRTVIEIGPGHGAITEILAGRANASSPSSSTAPSLPSLTFRFRDQPQVRDHRNRCPQDRSSRPHPARRDRRRHRQPALLHHLRHPAQALRRRLRRAPLARRPDDAARGRRPRRRLARRARLRPALGHRADERAGRAPLHPATIRLLAATRGLLHRAAA